MEIPTKEKYKSMNLKEREKTFQDFLDVKEKLSLKSINIYTSVIKKSTGKLSDLIGKEENLFKYADSKEFKGFLGQIKENSDYREIDKHSSGNINAALGKYEKFLELLKNRESLDEDDFTELECLQNENPASAKTSTEYGCIPDEVISTPSGKAIKKNISIAKKVIADSNYKCLYDETHPTFLTSKGKPYMEGHHLIPCTVINSEFFKERSKLDREENIVSICPTCHRAIHFGDDTTKRKLIEKLYSKQKVKLESVGLEIDLETILSLP
jgi:5-methylcytosine-specific restriction protein A